MAQHPSATLATPPPSPPFTAEPTQNRITNPTDPTPPAPPQQYAYTVLTTADAVPHPYVAGAYDPSADIQPYASAIPMDAAKLAQYVQLDQIGAPVGYWPPQEYYHAPMEMAVVDSSGQQHYLLIPEGAQGAGNSRVAWVQFPNYVGPEAGGDIIQVTAMPAVVDPVTARTDSGIDMGKQILYMTPNAATTSGAVLTPQSQPKPPTEPKQTQQQQQQQTGPVPPLKDTLPRTPQNPRLTVKTQAGDPPATHSKVEEGRGGAGSSGLLSFFQNRRQSANTETSAKLMASVANIISGANNNNNSSSSNANATSGAGGRRGRTEMVVDEDRGPARGWGGFKIRAKSRSQSRGRKEKKSETYLDEEARKGNERARASWAGRMGSPEREGSDTNSRAATPTTWIAPAAAAAAFKVPPPPPLESEDGGVEHPSTPASRTSSVPESMYEWLHQKRGGESSADSTPFGTLLRGSRWDGSSSDVATTILRDPTAYGAGSSSRESMALMESLARSRTTSNGSISLGTLLRSVGPVRSGSRSSMSNAGSVSVVGSGGGEGEDTLLKEVDEAMSIMSLSREQGALFGGTESSGRRESVVVAADTPSLMHSEIASKRASMDGGDADPVDRELVNELMSPRYSIASMFSVFGEEERATKKKMKAEMAREVMVESPPPAPGPSVERVVVTAYAYEEEVVEVAVTADSGAIPIDVVVEVEAAAEEIPNVQAEQAEESADRAEVAIVRAEESAANDSETSRSPALAAKAASVVASIASEQSLSSFSFVPSVDATKQAGEIRANDVSSITGSTHTGSSDSAYAVRPKTSHPKLVSNEMATRSVDRPGAAATSKKSKGITLFKLFTGKQKERDASMESVGKKSTAAPETLSISSSGSKTQSLLSPSIMSPSVDASSLSALSVHTTGGSSSADTISPRPLSVGVQSFGGSIRADDWDFEFGRLGREARRKSRDQVTTVVEPLGAQIRMAKQESARSTPQQGMSMAAAVRNSGSESSTPTIKDRRGRDPSPPQRGRGMERSSSPFRSFFSLPRSRSATPLDGSRMRSKSPSPRFGKSAVESERAVSTMPRMTQQQENAASPRMGEATAAVAVPTPKMTQATLSPNMLPSNVVAAMKGARPVGSGDKEGRRASYASQSASEASASEKRRLSNLSASTMGGSSSTATADDEHLRIYNRFLRRETPDLNLRQAMEVEEQERQKREDEERKAEKARKKEEEERGGKMRSALVGGDGSTVQWTAKRAVIGGRVEERATRDERDIDEREAEQIRRALVRGVDAQRQERGRGRYDGEVRRIGGGHVLERSPERRSSPVRGRGYSEEELYGVRGFIPGPAMRVPPVVQGRQQYRSPPPHLARRRPDFVDEEYDVPVARYMSPPPAAGGRYMSPPNPGQARYMSPPPVNPGRYMSPPPMQSRPPAGWNDERGRPERHSYAGMPSGRMVGDERRFRYEEEERGGRRVQRYEEEYVRAVPSRRRDEEMYRGMRDEVSSETLRRQERRRREAEQVGRFEYVGGRSYVERRPYEQEHVLRAGVQVQQYGRQEYYGGERSRRVEEEYVTERRRREVDPYGTDRQRREEEMYVVERRGHDVDPYVEQRLRREEEMYAAERRRREMDPYLMDRQRRGIEPHRQEYSLDRVRRDTDPRQDQYGGDRQRRAIYSDHEEEYAGRRGEVVQAPRPVGAVLAQVAGVSAHVTQIQVQPPAARADRAAVEGAETAAKSPLRPRRSILKRGNSSSDESPSPPPGVSSQRVLRFREEVETFEFEASEDEHAQWYVEENWEDGSGGGWVLEGEVGEDGLMYEDEEERAFGMKNMAMPPPRWRSSVIGHEDDDEIFLESTLY
ncbi:hypothetical protein BJ742DRAFT_166064 [Cladochytrium replicatum]|nr:hypothetical protein BJ742DRAFT_166064 [Cladochytrium replicatum]